MSLCCNFVLLSIRHYIVHLLFHELPLYGNVIGFHLRSSWCTSTIHPMSPKCNPLFQYEKYDINMIIMNLIHHQSFLICCPKIN